MTRRAALAWLVFLATRGTAVVIALIVLSHNHGIVNHSPWGEYADAFRRGLVPYRDYDLVYPPGLLFLSWLGSALPATAFHSVFIVVVFAFEIATFALLLRVRASSWFDPAVAYLLITVLAPLQLVQLYGLGAFYDSIPACALTVSLYLLRKEGTAREVGALLALAAGILLKTYPIVAAPFVLLYLARRHRSAMPAIRGGAIVGAAVALPIAALALLDPRGVAESYRYLGRRAIEWETLSGLAIHLGGDTGVGLWPDAEGFTRGLPTFGWGFFAIHGPIEQPVARVVSLLFVVSMLGAMILAMRRLVSWDHLVRYSLVAVVLLLLTAKVFSPLYIAWLFPLVALTQTDSKRTTRFVFALVAAIGTVTTVLTVWQFGPGTVGFSLVAARVVVMAALVGLIGFSE